MASPPVAKNEESRLEAILSFNMKPKGLAKGYAESSVHPDDAGRGVASSLTSPESPKNNTSCRKTEDENETDFTSK
jgi:hypothetical protein